MQDRFDEIRILSKKLNGEGNTALAHKEFEKALGLYLQAIQNLKNIPEKGFTSDDWRELAIYQNNAGIMCKDPQQKLTWYKKAAVSLTHIPKNNFTADDWPVDSYKKVTEALIR